MSDSAIPAWLQQILPQWFLRRPAFTEALWAAGQSAAFGICIYLTPPSQDGTFATFGSTVSWLGHHWWGLVTVVVVAVYRGNVARTKAAANAAKGP